VYQLVNKKLLTFSVLPITLSSVLYRRETWSLNLREHHRLTRKRLPLLYITQHDTEMRLRGGRSGVRIPAYSRDFYLTQRGPASLPFNRYRGLFFTGVKQVGREVASPTPNDEVKN
jgi:hypothetical protein